MGCCQPNTYNEDTLIQINVTFVMPVPSLELADPTTVTLYLLDPLGSQTEQTYNPGNIVRVSTGVYFYLFQPPSPGLWTYKWQGTGNVVATSSDTQIFVRGSLMAVA